MSSKVKVIYRLGGPYRAVSLSTAVRTFSEHTGKAHYKLKVIHSENQSEVCEAPPKPGGDKIKYLTSAVSWLNKHYNTGNKVVVFRVRRGHRGDTAEYNKFLRASGILAARILRPAKKPRNAVPARWPRAVAPAGGLVPVNVGEEPNAGNAPAVEGFRHARPRFVFNPLPRPRARQGRPGQ